MKVTRLSRISWVVSEILSSKDTRCLYLFVGHGDGLCVWFRLVLGV